MFAALDNGFLTVDDSKELQRICNRLSGAKIDALLRKWLAVLPQPFTAADWRPATAARPRCCRPSSP